MDIKIRRLRDVNDDGATFTQFLKTLSSNKTVSSSSIKALEEEGAYTTHITLTKLDTSSIMDRLYALIEKRSVLDGDIVVLSNNERLIVLKGQVVSAS